MTVAGRVTTQVSDFSVDAYRASQAIYDEDAWALYRMVLSRADEFHGSFGRDRIVSLSGADKIWADGGKDEVRSGTGDDRVWGGLENDWLHGEDGDDKLFGERGADRLLGGQGRDLLNGGGGKDRLDGEQGNDRLKGGAGADTFVFRENGGQDVAADFDSGDLLRLDRDLWTGRLSAAEVIDEFARANARGNTVLSFDDGERLVLKDFRDLVYLEDHLSLFR